MALSNFKKLSFRDYGICAFRNGAKRIPAHDKEFMTDIYSDKNMTEKERWDAFDLWVKGYDQANVESDK